MSVLSVTINVNNASFYYQCLFQKCFAKKTTLLQQNVVKWIYMYEYVINILHEYVVNVIIICWKHFPFFLFRFSLKDDSLCFFVLMLYILFTTDERRYLVRTSQIIVVYRLYYILGAFKINYPNLCVVYFLFLFVKLYLPLSFNVDS